MERQVLYTLIVDSFDVNLFNLPSLISIVDKLRNLKQCVLKFNLLNWSRGFYSLLSTGVYATPKPMEMMSYSPGARFLAVRVLLWIFGCLLARAVVQ